jgi:hypothetical protein
MKIYLYMMMVTLKDDSRTRLTSYIPSRTLSLSSRSNIYIYTYVYIHMYPLIYNNICIDPCILICIYIHVYIYIHITTIPQYLPVRNYIHMYVYANKYNIKNDISVHQ